MATYGSHEDHSIAPANYALRPQDIKIPLMDSSRTHKLLRAPAAEGSRTGEPLGKVGSVKRHNWKYVVLWGWKILPKSIRYWVKSWLRKMLPEKTLSSITPPPSPHGYPSVVALRNALREDHGYLFNSDGVIKAEYSHFESECPACDRRDFKFSFTKDFFNFSECNVCSHTFVNPRLNEKGLNYFYNEGAYTKLYNISKFFEMSEESAEGARKDSAHLLGLAAEILGQVSGKRLLEVGPGGKGILLEEALRLELIVSCVEIDQACCGHLQDLFGDTVQIHNSHVKDIYPEYAESFDIIVMRDVLEHIPAPIDFLKICQKLLKPGGVLVTRMPNQGGLVYKIAGPRHVCVFGFEHVSYWTEHSMRAALHEADLGTLSISTISTDLSLNEIRSLSVSLAEFENRFTSAFDTKHNLDTPARQLSALYQGLGRALESKGLTQDLLDFIDKTGLGSELVVVAEKKRTTH